MNSPTLSDDDNKSSFGSSRPLLFFVGDLRLMGNPAQQNNAVSADAKQSEFPRGKGSGG